MTVHVQHLRGSSQGRTQVFGGDHVRLGRNPGNDVEFSTTGDPAVSGAHGEIVKTDQGWLYRDLSSSNGSWMGERRVETVALHGGEELELGKGGPVVRITFQQAVAAAGVGTKTVAMMIQAAMENTRNQTSGKVPTGAFIKEVAGQARRHGSWPFKITVAVLIVGLSGAVGFLLWELRRTQDELDELAISKLGPGELGEWIAGTYGSAVHLLIYRTNLGFEQGFCTGFAVSSNQLLTNAHCVAQMESLAKEGATFFAAPNGGMGGRYQILSWRSHSGYNPAVQAPTADIGGLVVNGTLPAAVALAEQTQITALRPGARIFVYGFPGDLSNVGSPVATLTEGVIGRVTTFDGQGGSQENMRLLQYSAFTSKGTSGSPVFDKYGRVVAVNSGYYQGKSKVQIESLDDGTSRQAKVSRDLSGYSFGIRIDLAAEVLQ